MTQRYLSAAEMREIDRRCIEEIGIPGAVLMHNAGSAIFQEIDQSPVGVLCGKGNNGGDGFVVARLALQAGLDVHVVLTAPVERIEGDAQIYLRAYQNSGGRLRVVDTPEEVDASLAELSECGILVDALLGTGIQGEVRGITRAFIEKWPPVSTIAVDLPSGMNADTGEPCGICVRADTTVTFQYPKAGFQNDAAQIYLGRLVVADIGIPSACCDAPFG